MLKRNVVPYLGEAEPYYLGSGVVGAGGNLDGTWDFLIGPMYSSPNFIDKEELFIVIDGQPHLLKLQMKRGQQSGTFIGTVEINNIVIQVIDYTNFGQHWIGRCFQIKNLSMHDPRMVSIRANIAPCKQVVEFKAESNIIVRSYKEVHSAHSNIIAGNALSIRQDTTAVSYGGEAPNWVDRYAFISFNTSSTAVKRNETEFSLETLPVLLEAQAEVSMGLYHCMHFEDGISDEAYYEFICKMNPVQNAEQSFKEWEQWLNEGTKREIVDPRLANIVESILVLIKMQQCVDGGFIAGTRRYAFSYLRDGHGACRGLLASGHVKEVKAFIAWVHHKFEVFQMIPNSAEMGADFKMLQFLPPENLASEVTAYYIFVIRDYYRQTGDLGLLKQVEASVQHAMNIQLHYAEQFGGRLMFNGDETERYVPYKDGDIYGGFPALPDWKDEDWSMTSLAACISSLEFYIEYLSLMDKSAEDEVYKQKLEWLRASIDEHFWREDLGIHDWCSRKDGSVPSYRVTNLHLLPLWFGVRLNNEREKANALKMADYINSDGFLPIAPGVNHGFCGHSLGYLLFALTLTGDERAHSVFQTLTESHITGCWGTVSEFYGSSGVANPHNLRMFESGINLEAILKYLSQIIPTTVSHNDNDVSCARKKTGHPL